MRVTPLSTRNEGSNVRRLSSSAHTAQAEPPYQCKRGSLSSGIVQPHRGCLCVYVLRQEKKRLWSEVARRGDRLSKLAGIFNAYTIGFTKTQQLEIFKITAVK